MDKHEGGRRQQQAGCSVIHSLVGWKGEEGKKKKGDRVTISKDVRQREREECEIRPRKRPDSTLRVVRLQ